MTDAATNSRPPAIFVGSSSENVDLCHYLQAGLEAALPCEVTPWSSGVFQASKYSLESLVESARRSDFAVLVVTPDDMVTSRGKSSATARDNVIFELGLFMGALGRERTFIVADRSGVKLPSDLDGLTWLPYQRRTDGNKRAALNSAVLGITEQIRVRGVREVGSGSGAAIASSSQVRVSESDTLRREIERVCQDALAQGWTVKTYSETTLRLMSPKRRRHTFSIDDDARQSRIRLRTFIGELRGAGLRVNQSVRRPVRG